jgi:isoquinoline 1-oxidoreductase alpha subunit
MAIEVTVNGEQHQVQADGDTPLLWVLRDELRLTGTKYACGIAQCGACTVHVNGQPRRSCVLPVRLVEGARVTTIEGLSGPQAEAVQDAWREIDVPQCGYCQSGQIMSAVALLAQAGEVDDAAIDAGMVGNICRCATYVRIRQAIKNAAAELEV